MLRPVIWDNYGEALELKKYLTNLSPAQAGIEYKVHLKSLICVAELMHDVFASVYLIWNALELKSCEGIVSSNDQNHE